MSPSVSGGNGTISPSTTQTVNYDATPSFTADADHWLSHWNGGRNLPRRHAQREAMYTTGAVTASCTVIASFAINTYAVTPSVNNSHGSISPSTVQTVNYDSTSTFMVAANTGYTVIGVGGTLAAAR